MQKFIETVIGETSRPVAGATVTVYTAGTTTPATIYLTNGGAATTNPLTTDSDGMFYFYAADGRYDLLIEYDSASKTVSDILLEAPVDANTINATTSTIGTLNATTATLTSATVPTLGSTTATISNGTVTTLASTNATVTALNAVSATATTGTITTLTGTTIRTSTLSVGDVITSGNLQRIAGNASAAAFSNSISIEPTIQSDVTNSYRGVLSRPAVAASVTLPSIAHFYANPGTFGAGSSVSYQFGFYVESTMTGASNNYAFYGNLAASAGRWNFYAAGTALNYFAGRTLFGTTTDNGTDQIQSAGHIATTVAGQGFKIKEGLNAKMGSATLVAGTVTVSNTSVTANSKIFLTSNVDGGTPGFLRVSARTASTSFTITSSSLLDTSTVAWLIVEPA